jgi:hypothetical protein
VPAIDQPRRLNKLVFSSPFPSPVLIMGLMMQVHAFLVHALKGEAVPEVPTPPVSAC